MLIYHIFYNTKQSYLSNLFGQKDYLISFLHTYLLSRFRSSDKISENSTYIAKGENEKTMANIHDYLYWRGDLPLDQIPLNELDGLVLTRFAYMPFEELTLGQNETVGSLCKKLKTLPADKFRLDGDARFVMLLNEADRFNQLPVSDFVKHNDADAVVQFAAITLYLPDDSLYIAYCGTDSTLVGWKEDFYMSFMEDVPAQMEALDYARKILKKNPGKKFYLGGHSKGGNLAIYTAVNLPAELKANLLHVSNYDGPGFPNSYIQSHDFGSVLDRIDTFIPQESMIGRIHEHAEGFHVVESTESGIQQHDIYSWLMGPTLMTLLDKADDASEITYRAIQNILQSTSPAQRKEYIDRIFNLLTSTDANSFAEVFKNLPTKLDEVIKSVAAMTREDHKENQEMMSAMVRSFLDAALSYHEEKLPDFGGLLTNFKFDIPELPVLEKLKEKL